MYAKKDLLVVVVVGVVVLVDDVVVVGVVEDVVVVDVDGGAVHPGGRCPVDGTGAGSPAAGVRLQQEHHPHLPHQPAGDPEGIGDDNPAGGDRQKYR